QSIDFGAQQIETATNITCILLFRITDVAADGALSVELTVKRISGTLDGGPIWGGAIDFDTAPSAAGDKSKTDDDDGGGMRMPSASRVSSAFAELCGHAFTAKVDGGKLTEIDGVHQAIKAARKRAGKGTRYIGSLLNDGAIREIMSVAFVVLPKNPVAIGDGWEADPVDVIGAHYDSTRKIAFELTRADDVSAEMGLTGTIESFKIAKAEEDEDDEETKTRQMWASAKIRNGKVSGAVVYSRKDGWVLNSSLKGTMDIEMTDPRTGDGMKINVMTTANVERSKAVE